MNNQIEAILLGVLGNALSAIGAQVLGSGKRILVGDQILNRMKTQETSLQPVLRKAIDALAEDVEWNGPARIEEICIFLASPEVEEIARQICSTRIQVGQDSERIGLIREAFLRLFSLHLGLKQNQVKKPVENLFDALLMACDLAVSTALDNGILSAHEAKSSFRYRVLLDEVQNIRKNIDMLREMMEQADRPDVHSFLEFEKQYRYLVGERHNHITPPSYSLVHKVPIEKLYVQQTFRYIKQKGTTAHALSEFLANAYRVVILGNPGGGKSTFTQKLCYTLAQHYAERIFARRLVTPILVILRDYGTDKKNMKFSILQSIEATANSRYQIQPPSGAFDYLLLNGRVVVIFDGLDELLETNYRQEISKDIETFCKRYPSVPVIVTSREVGYEQAPLDTEVFATFYIDQFDNNQVVDYVSKWFDLDTGLTPYQRKIKIYNFLRESEGVSDLRSNPLLLSLMCNLYRGIGYIPRNRTDVYEKCTLMLFERWDSSRGILYPLVFEKHLKPTLRYLAHWIYSNGMSRQGIREKQLIAKIIEFLCPKRLEDPDESKQVAREFLDFCEGRAWVFTDMGTTAEGERQFQFTHQTFLEYFTAEYLVRSSRTPDQLAMALIPRIAEREWDIVAQLAFQIQEDQKHEAVDELLSELIKQCGGPSTEKKLNYLSFMVRCLSFLVPSTAITRAIVKSCFDFCIISTVVSAEIVDVNNRKEFADEGKLKDLIRSLLYSANENHSSIANALMELIIERANTGTFVEALIALEIGSYLFMFLDIPEAKVSLDYKPLDYWSKVSAHISNDIFEKCNERLKSLRSSIVVSLELFGQGRLSVPDLIQQYGTNMLFRSYPFIFHPDKRPLSPAEGLIATALSSEFLPRWQEQIPNYIVRLEEAGRLLPSYPTPWIVQRRAKTDARLESIIKIYNEVRVKALKHSLSLNADAFYGLFALMAAMLEDAEKSSNSEVKDKFYVLLNEITSGKMFNYLPMRWVFVARFAEHSKKSYVNKSRLAEEKTHTLGAEDLYKKVKEEMSQLEFSEIQQSFALRWIQKKIDFVRRPREHWEID